jgi:hypothetical protein
VDRDDVRAGGRELVEEALWILDHEVHIFEQAGPQRLYEHRAHRQLRAETTIHDIDVEHAGALSFKDPELTSKIEEIGAQDPDAEHRPRQVEQRHRVLDQRRSTEGGGGLMFGAERATEV